MGRAPCCEKVGLKRGPWSTEEDQMLINFIKQNGHSNWRALPKKAGLLRCGKSCRLRWTNYLRPDIKRGDFTQEEEDTILNLHQHLGNRWAAIASKLPGRTDNEIKNVWHTHLKKRLINQNPQTKLKKNTGSFSQPPCSVARSDGAENVDSIQQPSCEGEENTDSSQPSSCEGEENTDSRQPPPPCSMGRSDGKENIDSSVKNNNDDDSDDTVLVELAFAKDFLKNLWSEEESFENEWNFERYCERRNNDQATQEVQISSRGEAISSCSSSDSRDDIIDFWSSVLMRDGELSELQEI